MGEKRGAIVLVERSGFKKPLERPGCRWDDNTNWILRQDEWA
jgi:hypothetical protein